MKLSLTTLLRTLVFGLAAFASTCVPINGGAVEVSWTLRDPNGRAITDCSCAMPEIAKVRLKLVGRGGAIQGATPCAGHAQCDFACPRQTGATPFDIPETNPGEKYAISVVALGVDGAELTTVGAPAEILREVVRGQPTEVEALELDTPCATACGGMNISGVCAHP